MTAEASAYANPAPPQISKREHEFSSLQLHHTTNPYPADSVLNFAPFCLLTTVNAEPYGTFPPTLLTEAVGAPQCDASDNTAYIDP